MKLELNGRVDSNNAAAVEKDLLEKLAGHDGESVTIDTDGLDYISSAGLRVLLRIRKSHPDMSIIGVKPEVYDILEMTGFTEMMNVGKAYRVVSVEGCEEIGRGANGTIYRIDQDNVVKVYNNADALADIQHEREVAKLALILGIPTAISYDVVKVGESYGSVFELLNARSFSKIISSEPDKLEWCVDEYVKMLKKIHATSVPEGKLPDMRETAISWAEFMLDHLPEKEGNKLLSLIKAVPRDDHMLHGDYHTKNLELQNDEVLLIDMDTLAVGHPIFELGSIYNSFVGFSEVDSGQIMKFQGFDQETGRTFWRKSLAAYLGTDSEKKITEVEDKARIIGYTRMIRRSIRRGGLDSEFGKKEIEHWKQELISLIDKTDTLLFVPGELEVDADEKNLPEVMSFIEAHLDEINCPQKAKMQFSVAAEECFVNIAKYAYAPEKGGATIRAEFDDENSAVTLTFMDHGKPYDPLAHSDPDVSLPAEDRQIGGLGIFIMKKTMDDITYEYKDGQNILRLKKIM